MTASAEELEAEERDLGLVGMDGEGGEGQLPEHGREAEKSFKFDENAFLVGLSEGSSSGG